MAAWHLFFSLAADATSAIYTHANSSRNNICQNGFAQIRVIALDNKCLRSRKCFLCGCGLLISEQSDPTQICVFAMICSALTRVRVFLAHTNEFSHRGIFFTYDPYTQRLFVDNTYQVTKITLTEANREDPLSSEDVFKGILANFLIGAEDMITVYMFCEPGRESPKYVTEKEDHFSITLEYSRRTSILLQAARAPQRLVPTSPGGDEE
jgi:hypothetical protein